MYSGARSFRSTSSSMPASKFKRPQTPMQPMRQSLVTEQDEPDDDGDEEMIPDGDGEAESPNLEEVLQAQVEVLVSELQQAEEEGVAPEMLEELEVGVEKAAESLVTMREARQKLNDIRKDRGFGGKGAGKSNVPKGKPSGSQVSARKQDPQHPCWDCGQTGHWLGDPQCPKPGAGLHLPANKKKPKQVKIVEHHATNVTELVPDPEGPSTLAEHEIQMAENALSGKTLREALDFGSHEVHAGGTPQLMSDKRLVGALDSACNRTCTGSTWLQGYLDALADAPQSIKDLIQSVPEREVFRFGNGGTQESTRRWRLPMMVGNTLVCVWTSVVHVPSLGLLLGRDFLDGVGAVLSFSRRVLRADHLDGALIPLRQLMAGHFALQLLPKEWPMPGALKWRKLGADGVLECQVEGGDWLKRRLSALQISAEKPSHEHLITEHSEKLAHLSFAGLPVKADVHDRLAHSMAQTRSPIRNSTSKSPPLKTSSQRLTKNALKGRPVSSEMGAVGSPCRHQSNVAHFRAFAVGVATTLASLCSISIPFGWEHRAVGDAGRDDGREPWTLKAPLGQGKAVAGLHGPESGRCALAEGSPWMGAFVCGGFDAPRHALGPKFQEDCGEDQSSSFGRVAVGGREDRSSRPARRGRAKPFGTSWRTSGSQRGFDQVVPPSPFERGTQRYGGHLEGEDQTHAGYFESQPSRKVQSESQRLSRFDIGASKPAGVFKAHAGSKASSCDYGRRQPVVGPAAGEISKHALADPPACDVLHVNANAAPDGSRSSSNHPSGFRRRPMDEHSGRCIDAWGGSAASGRHTDVMHNPWSFDRDLKKGQALQIAQAWNQHVAERKRISTTSRAVRDILEMEWQKEMDEAQHEVFITGIEFPNPLVSEVYTNAQNVMKEARCRGHGVGTAMSLETGWDFLKASHRKAAIAKVKEEKPFCLVLAFPCGPWSPLMNLRPSFDLARKRQEGRILLRFALDLAKLQKREGRHFVLENPIPSRAWTLPLYWT